MAYPDTAVPQSPFSFLFGAGTNQSYDQLQAKRKRTDLLAAQIMGRQPKTVKEGIGSLLQSAALDAVRTAHYRPFQLNGEPTEVDTTISVVFRLSE